MDPEQDREARRLLDRYMVEVVERYGLCPWAAPARARGEVRTEVVAPTDVATALERFVADAGAAIGLIVIPAFTGDAAALRRVRDALLVDHGARIALADFHPLAALDLGDPHRLVPFLRRSPDPMLQAVRHELLAGLRRGGTAWSPREQIAALAGMPVTRPRDPTDEVAAVNHATVQAQTAAVVATLDDIARDRDAAYARFSACEAVRWRGSAR